MNLNNPENKLAFLEKELALQGKKSRRLAIPLAIYLGTGILIFIYSLLFWQSSIVFKINETRVLMHGTSFMAMLSVFLFFEWLCYWFWRQFLYSALLTWLHILITCGICLLFVATHKSYFRFHVTNPMQSALIQTLLKGELRFIEFRSLTAFVFAAAQALFLFNWGAAYFRSKKKKAIVV
ncbi:hypothetical protein EV199_1988 [Pseudobacter ginsenosidimutans]|uniref:Uncharacterized protein n=2 Tax=Pseudobacter ginsenosidimutans TaxID=661488 RepID=A0A4Q7N543_9BACT|nr:hypothetical protein EV199_1988 [Pseudobacter ginsenosidimutans]